MARSTALAAVLLSTLAVVACDSTDSDLETTDAQPMATSEAQDARTDAEIRTAVQAKYYTDDIVRGRRIDVSADDGVVTLRGTVENEAAREHAVYVARDVDGVAQVRDELQVRASAPADTAERRDVDRPGAGIVDRVADATQPMLVTTAIQAKYFLESGTKPFKIDVTTSADGVVTLEGAVETEAAKTSAVRIARETDGVVRVEDRLRVEPGLEGLRTGYTGSAPEGQSPDAWVTTKIQAKYFVDGDVRARNIDVDTTDGMVTLSGVVGNEAERRQAVALAWNTDGVRDVTDRLRVDAALNDRDDADPRAVADAAVDVERPDPWITMKIQAKYFLDTDVKGHEINVNTDDGVVTLSGTVENAEQKLEAEQIARETDGVDRVVNQLKVDAAGAQQ